MPFIRRSSKRENEDTKKLLLEGKQERIHLYKEEQLQHYTANFHIPQTNREACYLNVKNKSSYEAMFNGLVQEIEYLKRDVQLYLQKGHHTIPEDVQRSILHIVKYLELFQNRLKMALNLNDSNFMHTSDYREAARAKLTELFASNFMAKCMQVLNDGSRVVQKMHYYAELLNVFNEFLAKQGIYTKLFKPHDEIDFELLIPEAKKTTQILDFNGLIADVYTLPYFFNDPNYQGHALISEGSCVVYSTQ